MFMNVIINKTAILMYKKLQFIHLLTATNTSKTAKIIKGDIIKHSGGVGKKGRGTQEGAIFGMQLQITQR